MRKTTQRFRIAVLLLLTMLLVTGISTNAMAADSETFLLELTGNAKESLSNPFKVSVVLHLPDRAAEQETALYSSQLEIPFDGSCLAFSETESKTVTGFDLNVQETPGKTAILISSLTEDREGMAVSEGMCLAELVFYPKKEGNYHFSIVGIKLHDEKGDLKSADARDFTIQVEKTQETDPNPGGGTSGGGSSSGGGGAGAGGAVLETVTLRFEVNGGSPLASRTGNRGEKIALDELVPTKEGCTFEGWYLDSALTLSCTSLTLQENMTVYAKWALALPKDQTFAFSDVAEQDWFCPDILWAFRKGLMNGVSETLFAPNESASRGMIVTILHRMEGEPQTGEKEPVFSDVPQNAYYANAIAWALERKIVTGYGDGRFGPNDPVTREQFVSILYRYCFADGEAVLDPAGDFEAYSDEDQISPYAAAPMRWACQTGLIQGSNGVLTPKGNATRAQIAAILHRFCSE